MKPITRLILTALALFGGALHADITSHLPGGGGARYQFVGGTTDPGQAGFEEVKSKYEKAKAAPASWLQNGFHRGACFRLTTHRLVGEGKAMRPEPLVPPVYRAIESSLFNAFVAGSGPEGKAGLALSTSAARSPYDSQQAVLAERDRIAKGSAALRFGRFHPDAPVENDPGDGRSSLVFHARLSPAITGDAYHHLQTIYVRQGPGGADLFHVVETFTPAAAGGGEPTTIAEIYCR